MEMPEVLSVFEILIGAQVGSQLLNPVKLGGEGLDLLELSVQKGDFVLSRNHVSHVQVFFEDFLYSLDCVSPNIHLRELSLCSLLTVLLMPSLTSLISASLNSDTSPRIFSTANIRSSRRAKYSFIIYI